MNLANWLGRVAARAAERPALFAGTRLVATYGQFDTGAAGFAGWLRDQGVAAGDRVALYLPNAPDYLIALFGIWYAGAVVVPVNAKLHGVEAAFILKDSGAKIVIATGIHVAALQEASVEARIVDAADGLPQAGPVLPASRGPDDLAWLFYTSGTTGTPKGVQITHGMLMAMALSYHADVDDVREDDATLYAAPMSHGAGLYALMHVQMGARHVCPVSGGFDPAEVLDLAAHFGRAHMFAAPTMVTRLTAFAQAQGRDGTGLRTVVYAGGPMYVADIIRAQAVFGNIFVQIYGQGECPMAITCLPRADIADRNHADWMNRLGSVGRAQSCVEVAISDAGGRILPVGTQGEVIVRGAAVMPGYWRNPKATAETLQDGWLRTGDLGVMDAAGYLTLKDRSKDLIISGGSNVYPREVEEVLLRHDDVREVSVVGRAHPDWGEEVVAFVVGDVTEGDLDALCRASIARFKAPKAYFFVQELPKNNYGKVLKTELRERLGRRA